MAKDEPPPRPVLHGSDRVIEKGKNGTLAGLERALTMRR